jgi:hypothetical protein
MLNAHNPSSTNRHRSKRTIRLEHRRRIVRRVLFETHTSLSRSDLVSQKRSGGGFEPGTAGADLRSGGGAGPGRGPIRAAVHLVPACAAEVLQIVDVEAKRHHQQRHPQLLCEEFLLRLLLAKPGRIPLQIANRSLPVHAVVEMLPALPPGGAGLMAYRQCAMRNAPIHLCPCRLCVIAVLLRAVTSIPPSMPRCSTPGAAGVQRAATSCGLRAPPLCINRCALRYIYMHCPAAMMS